MRCPLHFLPPHRPPPVQAPDGSLQSVSCSRRMDLPLGASLTGLERLRQGEELPVRNCFQGSSVLRGEAEHVQAATCMTPPDASDSTESH